MRAGHQRVSAPAGRRCDTNRCVNYQPTAPPHLPTGAIIAIVVFYIAFIAFFAWMYVRIVRRTGYSGWWVLMALVPIGNLVMLCLFAFKEWPIQRELTYLRGYAAATGLPGYVPAPPGSAPTPYGSAPAPYSYGQTPPGYGQTPPGDGPPQPDERA
jgi:hypothetical protein